MHAAMQLPERSGAEIGWRQCSRTYPILLRSPPPCSGGLLAGPRLPPRRCPAQVWRVGGISPFIPLRISTLRFLNCAFFFVFHLYSNVCPAKHISSNTSGTISILKAYVSKVCLFLPFWIVIGSRNSLFRTANTPHPIFIL